MKRKQIKKRDFVTYSVPSGKVSAIVRTAHRDGTYTVEARHFINEKGRTLMGYLGYRYRMNAADLRLTQEPRQ